jgi:pimeloyl-ACP methyl ester carboxylesterase
MSVIARPVPSTPAPPAPEPGGMVLHDRRVIVDGITTHYLEAGTGPPVVLLHGHEQSATSWRWVIPTLARTHQVLAVSLPGHGETDPAAGWLRTRP